MHDKEITLENAFLEIELANLRGYEWRVIKADFGDSNCFFDVENSCYDSELKKLIDETGKLSLEEWTSHIFSHPIGSMKTFYSMYKMRARVLSRERS